MERLEEITTAAEAEKAFKNAIRNLDLKTVAAIESDPYESPGDDPLIAHAKAAYRLRTHLCNGVIWGEKGDVVHHPV